MYNAEYYIDSASLVITAGTTVHYIFLTLLSNVLVIQGQMKWVKVTGPGAVGKSYCFAGNTWEECDASNFIEEMPRRTQYIPKKRWCYSLQRIF
jgi:hypothetical protein